MSRIVRRIRLTISFAVALLLTAVSARSQSPKRDSVRHISGEPVQITGKQEFPGLSNVDPVEVTILPKSQLLDRANVFTLSEALERSTPSLSVRSYGPLGSIALASFRGLPPEYTVVYRDGIRITTEQNSLTDFAKFALGDVDQIEILSGGAAMLLGGDAMGAAINIISKHPTSSSLTVGSAITSYSDLSEMPEQEYHFSGTEKLSDDLGITVTGMTAFSRGDFPFFQSTTGAIVRRENDDAHTANASVGAEWHMPTDGTLTAKSTFSRQDRGAPGFVTTDYRGATLLYARQYDEDFFLATGIGQPLNDAWRLDGNLSYQSQYETYDNPQGNVHDRYLNRIYAANGRTTWNASSALSLVGGLDFERSELFSNENAIAPGDTIIARSRASLFVTGKYRPFTWIIGFGGLRIEKISDLEAAQLLPQFSLDLTPFGEELTMSGSFSKSFHTPTLNEFYWRQLGNASLQAERGTSYQATVRYAPEWLVGAKTSVTWFTTDISNEIVWLPQSDGLYHPINIFSARSRGWELVASYNATLGNNWRAEALVSYTLDHAINLTPVPSYFGKELQYSTPTASLTSASITWTALGTLAVTARYKGHRHSLPTNGDPSLSFDANEELYPYTILDVAFTSIAVQLSTAFSLRASLTIQNIEDKQYSEIFNYPMPGRHATLGVEISTHQSNEGERQ